jgi:Mg-chelatase subunit ChlD
MFAQGREQPMNNAIVQGSLRAIAQQSGKSLAESFLSCDVIVIVDTSGSMHSQDAPGGLSRYDAACKELASLQSHLPGKVAVISFASDTQFCPAGIPVNLGGGTNMAGALTFVKCADAIEGMRFFLISDGQANDERATMEVAKKFQNKIDTIYVGPEDHPVGRDFLIRLAASTGGTHTLAAQTKELTQKIETLLLKA